MGSRAEVLREQILRGSQQGTVASGSTAFKLRGTEGYSECDEMQPEGCPGVRRRHRPLEVVSSQSDSESSEFDAGRLPKRSKPGTGSKQPAKKQVRTSSSAIPVAAADAPSAEVVVDYF